MGNSGLAGMTRGVTRSALGYTRTGVGVIGAGGRTDITVGVLLTMR